MERKGISIQEASKLTGFAESTLQQACVHGEIKAHKEDLIHWTVDVDSLKDYSSKHHPHLTPRRKRFKKRSKDAK